MSWVGSNICKALDFGNQLIAVWLKFFRLHELINSYFERTNSQSTSKSNSHDDTFVPDKADENDNGLVVLDSVKQPHVLWRKQKAQKANDGMLLKIDAPVRAMQNVFGKSKWKYSHLNPSSAWEPSKWYCKDLRFAKPK